MRKTKKQILGFLGLGVVVAMTAVAIALPSPRASAAGSMTDTITVRVVGETPDVSISGIESGSEFLDAEKDITVSYENVGSVKVVLEYTDTEGNVHETVLMDETTDFEPGQRDFHLDLRGPQYGYGDYVIKVTGTGNDGVKDEDAIEFTRIPFTAEIEEEKENGDQVVNLDYCPDDQPSTSEGEIEKFIVTVYDKDGNVVDSIGSIIVQSPEKTVTIPFGKNNVPDGEYTIEIVAVDSNGVELSKKYLTTKVGEEPIPVPDTSAPDTGRLFNNLNISQSDFLITGLMIFFLVGICGIVFISKRGKNSRRR